MHTYKDTKMKFSKLVESYKESKLKALSELMVEEATEEEFNKEIKIAQDQSQGKIKKKISAASTKGVAIQKEEMEQIDELNKDTIHSYKKKADKDVDDLIDQAPKKDIGEKVRKRLDGMERAEKRLNKEEVQRANIPAYLRKQKGEAPLKLDDLKRKDTMSDLENLKRMKKEKLGEKIQDMVIQKQLDEVISRDAEASEWITDFVNSADPRLEGKSKKERMKMALGAYYKEHPEKSNK